MSGEIVKKIEDNLKHTPSKRIGDVNILFLAKTVEDLQEYVSDLRTKIEKKIDNGVTSRLTAIWEKVNSMPCSTHVETMRRIEETIRLRIEIAQAKSSTNKVLIAWLFVLYGTVVAGLIFTVIKVWNV